MPSIVLYAVLLINSITPIAIVSKLKKIIQECPIENVVIPILIF